MNKQTEALKLALAAVYETIIQWDEGGGKRSRRELARRIVALAEQPAQQEPVASLLVGQDSDGRYVSIAAKAHADTLPLGEHKLYTSPPASKPLTDEQRRETINRAWNDYLRGEGDDSFGWYLSQAIEAAHGIKGDA